VISAFISDFTKTKAICMKCVQKFVRNKGFGTCYRRLFFWRKAKSASNGYIGYIFGGATVLELYYSPIRAIVFPNITKRNYIIHQLEHQFFQL